VVSLSILQQTSAARTGGLPRPCRMQKTATMTAATVKEAAKHFGVDPATVRRWIDKHHCPCVRRGSRGPGHGARLDLAAVAAWRGRANGPAGLSAEDVLQRIAGALWEALEHDHADIRAGVSRDDIAAAFIVVFERCCTTFHVSFRWDQQPEPIRALMREL